jgi:hypothetical protein
MTARGQSGDRTAFIAACDDCDWRSEQTDPGTRYDRALGHAERTGHAVSLYRRDLTGRVSLDP